MAGHLGRALPQRRPRTRSHTSACSPPKGANRRCKRIASGQLWPDGSVKWALLSFRANVLPESSAEYTLEYGGQVRPAGLKTGLLVEEHAGRVAVVTGPLHIEIDRSKLSLPGKVGDQNGDGRVYRRQRGVRRRGQLR